MKQETALRILKSGKNVFLTGSAGAGKTYVLNQYIQYLKDRKVNVAVTASTGIAATHMKGVTIHSWAGIGVKETLSKRDLMFMNNKKYIKKPLEKVKVLIIDEISMLHRNQLELVDQVLQYFKSKNQAFGAIQVVLCGDFFQLPPVGNPGERSSDKFAFMANAFVEAAFEVCYLTEQYRQDDNRLNSILNGIRSGEISAEARTLLANAQTTKFEEGWDPTKLYTHNYDVDQINQQHLDQLPGEKIFFKAKTTGDKKIVEVLKKTVLTKESLELKDGAKVMFVKNNPESGYINGTTGKVVGFSEIGLPIVQIASGEKITATPEKWMIEEEEGTALASYSQIPLRLAWAITIHKSQGMTLDSAEIDLSRTFERGQGYVALSRLKSMDRLRLVGFNEVALQVDGLAMKADKRFMELSTKAEQEVDEAELEEEAKSFIKACGGKNLVRKLSSEELEEYKKTKQLP